MTLQRRNFETNVTQQIEGLELDFLSRRLKVLGSLGEMLVKRDRNSTWRDDVEQYK